MKILFYVPFDVLQRANGGKTVFFKTKEYLERAGVQVDLFDPWKSKFRDYDIVHCFGMQSTDLWDFVKTDGLKLAVTPISWFGVYATLRSRVKRWVKRQVRSKIHCPLHAYWWEECFGWPNVFFPQSHEQSRQLQLAFGVLPERCRVVRHGVDERFASADPTQFIERYRTTDFVLCVGRFEPRKNQLALIRALKGTGLKIVFIGNPHSAAEDWYFQQCRKEGDGVAEFIMDVGHDSPLLESAYAAARVLVMPGLLEFPGLAALEAGLAGCNVAVTREGVAHEYLGAHARYLNPRSTQSIRDVVLDCYQKGSPSNIALQEHVKKNFLWENVIQENIEGYRRIMNRDPSLGATDE
jgi:glycosyltransferase involved in cell wall biosynthesis